MVSNRDEVSVDLRCVLLGISKALDAVGVDELHHGHRVGYIAYCCAKKMGWSEEQAQLGFALGLVHDCGVSQAGELSMLLTEMHSECFHAHCERGFQLLSECEPLAALSLPTLYHHTPWATLELNSTISDSDKLLAALIFISDRVDYLYSVSQPDQYGNLCRAGKQSIIDQLTSNAGELFETNMVQHMCELVDNDDFWFSMNCEYIEALSRQLEPVPFYGTNLGLDETIELAEFIAKIVDAKSTFTFQHSSKVAILTRYIGKQLGYSNRTQKKLYLAGLVHDFGKLKTPDHVLHKPGDLTEQEYNCIKRHATDTRFALQSMLKSQDVIEWASNHHERLDGSGYPKGKTAKELDQPSRIVAVADVFQALTQSRPYREGIPLDIALNILAQQVIDNELDAVVFQCVKDNAHTCYELSVGKESVPKEKPSEVR
ncbi:HD domain-containing phosphohydrolase [Vibrio paucivorans]